MGGLGAPSGGPDGKTTTAGPTILGLLAFGLTALLFGLTQLPGPWNHDLVTGTTTLPFLYLNGHPVASISGTIEVFGGLVLVLLGILMLWLYKSEVFWGTAMFGYGAFFVVLAGVTSTSAAFDYGTAAIALIWVLFTLTYLINSMKHGWLTFLFFLFLFIGMILLAVQYWQAGAASKISGEEWGAIAGFWIVAGVLAWYLGTVKLTELTYGRKLLPT